MIDLPTGGKFRQFAFSPDARQLAVSSSRVAGKPDVTRLILLSTGQVQREFPVTGRLIFRPDGKRLAVVSPSSKKLQAVVYDLASGDEVFRTERPRGQIGAFSFFTAAFGPQGQLLMVRNEADSTVVWDMNADKSYATVPWGKQDGGTRVKLTPDARMLVRIIRGPIGPRYDVWDLVNRRTHMQIDMVEGSMAIELPKFTPDYQWAALVYFVTDFAATRTRDSSGPGGADPQAGVLLQNAKTPGKKVHIRNRQMPVSIDIHPGGKLLAVACLAGDIEIYTMGDMKRVFSLHMAARGDPFIRFTPDGKSLAIGRYRQSRLQLVNLDKLKRELTGIGLGL
ncbi:MAG: WD40 repeat domain-containing protein [Phycisphaerae bacterium]|nr:WD40 repeat domain-containing protein [Phycisphaerae bacterium]